MYNRSVKCKKASVSLPRSICEPCQVVSGQGRQPDCTFLIVGTYQLLYTHSITAGHRNMQQRCFFGARCLHGAVRGKTVKDEDFCLTCMESLCPTRCLPCHLGDPFWSSGLPDGYMQVKCTGQPRSKPAKERCAARNMHAAAPLNLAQLPRPFLAKGAPHSSSAPHLGNEEGETAGSAGEELLKHNDVLVATDNRLLNNFIWQLQ